jgi:phosphomannomutase
MLEFLRKLRNEVYIAIVGGSDLAKQEEQLGPTILEDFDYVFSENGLVVSRERNGAVVVLLF